MGRFLDVSKEPTCSNCTTSRWNVGRVFMADSNVGTEARVSSVVSAINAIFASALFNLNNLLCITSVSLSPVTLAN